MEEEKLIVLPLADDKGIVDILTVAKLLSCQDRTIIGYIDKGLFPKPVKIVDGKRYFLEKEILSAFGIDDFNDELIKTSDAAKYLEIAVASLRNIVKKGHLTEIKLINTQGSGGWMIKKQVENFKLFYSMESVKLGEIGGNELKRNKFIELCFNDYNIDAMKQIISEDDIWLLKKVLVEDIKLDALCKELKISNWMIQRNWKWAVRKFTNHLSSLPKLIERIEREKLEKEFEIRTKMINEAEEKLREKVERINKLIVNMNDKIELPEDIKMDLSYEIEKHEFRKRFERKLSEIGFSVRAMNTFIAMDLETLYDLVSFTSRDVLKFRNMGKKTLEEVIEKLNSLELHLGMKIKNL